MKGKFFLALFVCLFTVSIASAQNDFRLDEAATKAFIKTDNLQIDLVFENKIQSFSTAIQLEILDTNDKVLVKSETRKIIKRDRQTMPIELSFDYSKNSDGYLWYRLRYTVTPDAAADSLPISGIVSLSEITPEIFEVRAAASERIFSGMNYRARVRAFQPVTNLPMPNVKIAGEVELDTESKDDELKLKASGVTDRNGYALLDFKIPPDAKLDDGELKITGEKNGIAREAESDLDVSETEYSVYLNTDKPIYQPNQKLFARGLFLQKDISGAATKAVGERELEFVVKDEDDTILYRETVKTSRFGIASISWQIPENAKLGTYRIVVEADEDLSIDQIYFKVSRYDLPNFTVNAKPDKTFYLPGENTAEITVGADYLFGKPVAKGAVKIVREKSREWNYKEQKWEIEEEQTFTGETGADGKYVARIDLTKAHADLKDEEYRRFEDLSFAAYFTDQTTNRTEQRRFDVRVSKEAIHVYLVGLDSYDEQNPKLPVRFYVSTFYADGAPAACDVEIKGKHDLEGDDKFQTLARIKTNILGAGKVELLNIKPDADDYYDDLDVKIIASDADNQKGTHEDEISIDEDAKAILISTDKTIYRAGEPLKIEIVSTEIDKDVYVDVVRNLAVVESRIVRLKNRRATLKIPYRAEFQNNLTIAAYIDDHGKAIDDARGVIYPRPANLQINVSNVKADYRPNEEAKLDFNVLSFDKTPLETALGVIVFDKAIEERARTDAEFGGSNVNQFGGYYELLDSDLNRIDTTKLISKDLQRRVELFLSDSSYSPNFFESSEYETNLKSVFKTHFDKQFTVVEAALKAQYAKNYAHPADDNSLRQILNASSVDFDKLRDPWGNLYRTIFTIEREQNVVAVKSAGANKIFGDKDDLIVLELKFKYFAPLGLAIDRAAADYHARTDLFVRDYETLRSELNRENIDLDALRDRWNNPYKIEFGVSGRYFTIDFKSGGTDGKFDNSYDDFTIWANQTDYFTETESRLQAVLSNYARRKESFPKNENEFKEILKTDVIDFDALRDGWNRPLALKFEVSARYSDKVKTESVAQYGGQSEKKMTVTPVTQQVATFRLQSAGADGVFDNGDDVSLTTFSGVVSEQTKNDAKPIELKTETVFTGGKGAIRGTITDATGAVVPGAKVTGTNEQTETIYEAETDENGIYLLRNLPSGKYSVKVESPGFSVSIVSNVPVRSSNLTELNFSLQVSGSTATVEISAGGDVINSTNASVSQRSVQSLYTIAPTISRSGLRDASSDSENNGTSDVNGKTTILQQTATPRLREYFPETLVWSPELVTDKNGKATLKFKLGDNITTWKLYAIASNAEGKIGVTKREIKAFQPFFVDLEPPKFLTVGDEISLPVQIRNYTDAKQTVSVTMANGDWFNFLNAANRQIEVAPNDSQNAIFGFKANAAASDAKQRVTAIAGKDSDAIEKSVTVRPNGKEIVKTESQIFRDVANFDVNFPAAALPDTQKAQLKIYPNLLAHVAESIEGLLQRPYGCGEQTISSTYPNLMILKVAPKDSKLRPQAEKFLQKGYEQLLSYQHADGGFSVWTKDAPDAALTAYAIRFLIDASSLVAVDETVIKNARNWLIKQQRGDGSWTRMYSWEKTEDARRTKMLTTYIARILAMNAKDTEEKETQNALQKALTYLKIRNAEIDEPYSLALFGLALLDAGNSADAEAIAARLEPMAKAENSGAYWNLETNTPFYGWGTAGRIETTALVVQLLTKIQNAKVKSENSKSEDLISRGTTFLLKNKDRYGVWYSTQTTINVLDAFLAAIGDGETTNDQNRVAEIFVNSRKLKDVALPPENSLGFPLYVDVPINSNSNRIEIKIGGGKSATMWQIVETHYIGWQNYEANGRDENQSRALRFSYDCDKREAKLTDEITCAVEAERIGFKGYGMLLAEIGLPPGAEVDRASLEKAKAENWNFSRYDVLPDRIVVYLWAQAGGAKFNFKFKPRYGINAQTAPSIVYDYYNPEAQATIAPLKFSVK